MTTPNLDTHTPLTDFTHCHAGIVGHLDSFGELPALLAPAMRAREVAADAVAFFHAALHEHHADEERELFPAVLQSARPGEEHDRVKQLTDRLTREHRDIEARWAHLEPQLKKLAKGQPATMKGEAITHLVRLYKAHAKFEEDEFLPLSETILGRNSNHMAALGMSLHLRHAPPVVGHI